MFTNWDRNIEVIRCKWYVYIEKQWKKSLNLPIGAIYDGKTLHNSIVDSQGTTITPWGVFERYATSVNPIYPNGYAEAKYSNDSNQVLKKIRRTPYYLPLKQENANWEEKEMKSKKWG